ncbi:MAG: type II toxin-antitoxin system VapC family toxin [Chthoniobacteraceae bacterium]
MRVALDTNAYSDFLRGVPGRVRVVQAAERLFLPLIVLGELRAGFAAGSREEENVETLRQFLASPRASVLVPDETTTEHYARVFVQLRRKGVGIPTNDLWIAALVLQHDLELCSSDAHFEHVEGLRLC